MYTGYAFANIKSGWTADIKSKKSVEIKSKGNNANEVCCIAGISIFTFYYRAYVYIYLIYEFLTLIYKLIKIISELNFYWVNLFILWVY